MKLIPVLTEKSLKNVAEGKYTFWVEWGVDKNKIRKAIERVFDVHVVDIKTINKRKELKTTLTGKTKVINARKKAIVRLREKEKIDLFEEAKK